MNQPWWATALLISVIGIIVAIMDEFGIFPRSWRGLGMVICVACIIAALGMSLLNLTR